VAEPSHPVLDAVRPLLDRIGAVVVGPAELRADDVPLAWDGVIVAGIRLSAPSADLPVEHPGVVDGTRQSADAATGPPSRAPAQSGAAAGQAQPATVDRAAGPAGDSEQPGGLEGIIADLERSLGTPLAELSRTGKQQAVRLLEEGGAFYYRKSVEVVAAALGVSRFTVYNYLNRDRA
jgi:hypothetical protein